VKWLADENLDNDILRGIRRRMAGFDVVRVQDVDEISGLDDAAVLEWATANDRVLLTHDLSTMIPAMQEQAKRFGSCSPILFVRDSLPVSLVIEEILLLDECSIPADWAAAVIYLPLE
jgi:predicted nuclease of predicted toxin-antitoxin system